MEKYTKEQLNAMDKEALVQMLYNTQQMLRNNQQLLETLVTDGYQVYHSLEKDAETQFKVAGCWAHARRKFADPVKAMGVEKAKGTVAYEALGMNSA